MEPLVKIQNLSKHFPSGRGRALKAVDGVSLEIYRGETLGVVGESGCGKTTLGRTVVRLYRPTSGRVLFDGIDVHQAAPREKKSLHRRMQMIFQDPRSSLNPRMTAGETIGEALDIHRLARGEARRRRIAELLSLVGLDPGQAGRFPHEFSGGQQQRIGLARALAVEPEFIVCDEPVSALDVSIQAQVLNLLEELQEKLGLTFLFISHDLSVVRHVSHRVAVMYLGRLVELAPAGDLYEEPLHPYTRALLSAIPSADPDLRPGSLLSVTGGEPSPVDPPPGCVFSWRCPQAAQDCRQSAPPLREAGGGRQVACHRAWREEKKAGTSRYK